MVRNPSININKTYPTLVGRDPEVEFGVDNMHSFFIMAMFTGREELFYEMLKNPRLDLSFKCSMFGRTALHYAVERVSFMRF